MSVENLLLMERYELHHNFDWIYEKEGLKISVQGGSRNYSTPKEDYYNLNEYTEYEVYITDDNLFDEDLERNHPKLYSILGEFLEYGSYSTFTYVPKEVVIKLLKEVNN